VLRVAFLFFLLFRRGKNKRVQGAHFFRAEEEFFRIFLGSTKLIAHCNNINTERERERERERESKEEEEEEEEEETV